MEVVFRSNAGEVAVLDVMMLEVQLKFRTKETEETRGSCRENEMMVRYEVGRIALMNTDACGNAVRGSERKSRRMAECTGTTDDCKASVWVWRMRQPRSVTAQK